MLIKVKDLALRKIVFDESFQPGAVELGEEVEQTTPLKTSGRAELLRENRGAGFSAQVEIRCARCLDPVPYHVQENFDLVYRPQGVDAVADEASISLAETEIGYYQGEGLLLEDVLKEQLLLALPVKQVCRRDCKGLCPHCGGNLNLESCNCVSTMTDPRWAALEDIRKKLER